MANPKIHDAPFMNLVSPGGRCSSTEVFSSQSMVARGIRPDMLKRHCSKDLTPATTAEFPFAACKSPEEMLSLYSQRYGSRYEQHLVSNCKMDLFAQLSSPLLQHSYCSKIQPCTFPNAPTVSKNNCESSVCQSLFRSHMSTRLTFAFSSAVESKKDDQRE